MLRAMMRVAVELVTTASPLKVPSMMLKALPRPGLSKFGLTASMLSNVISAIVIPKGDG